MRIKERSIIKNKLNGLWEKSNRERTQWKMVHAQGDNSYESTKVSNDHEINKRSDNLNEGGMPQCASMINKVKREFIGISNRSQQIIH